MNISEFMERNGDMNNFFTNEASANRMKHVPDNKEYTALSQPVNLAARLEQMAQADQILVCSETHEAVKDFY